VSKPDLDEPDNGVYLREGCGEEFEPADGEQCVCGVFYCAECYENHIMDCEEDDY